MGKSGFLRERITEEQVRQLVQLLARVGKVPPRLGADFARYRIDPDDDYLVAYALVYDVDCLVTGDPHLLVFGTIEATTIIAPTQFLEAVGSL